MNEHRPTEYTGAVNNNHILFFSDKFQSTGHVTITAEGTQGLHTFSCFYRCPCSTAAVTGLPVDAGTVWNKTAVFGAAIKETVAWKCYTIKIYLASSEGRCWGRNEKVNWADRSENEVVLHTVKEERNILHTVKQRNANWTGHIMRGDCLLKRVIEGKMEGTGRLWRRRKQLLDDLKEERRCWKLKEESLDRTVWRTHFGRGSGPFVRQTAEWMNKWKIRGCNTLQ